MASGAAVIADGDRTKEIGDQHRQLLAIDMESYAVFAAATEAPEPRPTAISLKSICDFGDGNKDDRYQRYATYTSARVTAALFAMFS